MQVSVNAASNYAQQRVAKTKRHMEKTYGEGLVGLFNEEGVPTHKALRASRMRPGANYIDLFQLPPIDAESFKSALIGFAKGLQYDGMIQDGIDAISQSVSQIAQSDCFYSIWSLQDTIGTLVYDFTHIIHNGSVNWWDITVYDNVHVIGDFTVAYQ